MSQLQTQSPSETGEVKSSRWEPKTWSWWYESIIDWMLTNPDRTKKECARDFGVSYTFIIMLTNTDMFKERFAERRARLSEAIEEDIKNGLTRVAKKSLELLEGRLAQDEQKRIRFEDLKNIADMSLSRMGYGVPQGNGHVNVQVNLGASPQAVESARARIREVGNSSPRMIEHQNLPVEPPLRAEPSPSIMGTDNEGGALAGASQTQAVSDTPGRERSSLDPKGDAPALLSREREITNDTDFECDIAELDELLAGGSRKEGAGDDR